MTESQLPEESVFLQALEIESAAERAAFVEQVCGNDAPLRAGVEALLRASEKSGDLLDVSLRPTSHCSTPTTDQPLAERLGTTIGPYKLLQQIGEGGMGVVYMAEQKVPVERRVALKIIKPGMDSRQVIARFEAERQALALMDHPNIAKVLDAGTTASGRPYFVMELVKGVPITKYCDEKHLSLKQRLELMIPVCQAIQHAHQKGITHRDIKPTNVLVAQYDGRPVPKVIDFGVAKATAQKLTERTLFTELGQVIGTIEYMSPEQAELNQLDIDTRSDIYSLGVLLYELLTGSTPFDKQKLRAAAFHEMLRIIREDEPPKPSTNLSTTGTLPSIAANRQTEPARLSKAVRGELDWIVMKALEKDRNRRYETANGFAADIQRYLADEPVHACPPSAAYRFGKLARRHKAAISTIALLAAALLIGTAVCAWQAIRATRAEVRAKDNESLAKSNEALAQGNEAHALSEQQKAEEQERLVRAALAEVRRQRRKARDAVDEMYTQVAEKWLEDQPTLTTVQRDFLEKALVLYQGFADESPADPQVQLEALHAYHRVGSIRKGLGQYEQAETAFRRAIEQSDSLIENNPDRPELFLERAFGRLELANVCRATGVRTNEANEHANRARDELLKLNSAELKRPEERQKLGKAWNAVSSQFLNQEGRRPEAEAAVQASMAIWKSLAADYPTDIEYRIGLAHAYVTRATNQLRWRGPDENPESTLLAADNQLSNVLKDRPGDVACRRSLAGVLNNRSVELLMQKRYAETEEFQLRAVTLYEKLVTDFPEFPVYQLELANAVGSLAQSMNYLGRRSEEMEYLRRSQEVSEKLAERYPDVMSHTFEYFRHARNLIELLQQEKRHDETRKLLDQTSTRAREILKAHPADREVILAFCNIFSYRAKIFIGLDDHTQATHAIAELPATAIQFAPERSPPEVVKKAMHCRSFSHMEQMLIACISLAERDNSLSPIERAKVVQDYSKRAQSFHQEAERAAEDWARATSSAKQAALVRRTGEAMIAQERDESSKDWTSRGWNFLLFKALIQEASRHLTDDFQQFLVADLLTTAPEELRDPELVLTLARRAVELKPAESMCWQSLGWALYRVGDWKGCLETLEKRTRGYKKSFVWAMAHWQLGNQQEALAAFEQADKWLEGSAAERLKRGTHPSPTMEKRLRDEAAALLGLTPSPVEPASNPTPNP